MTPRAKVILLFFSLLVPIWLFNLFFILRATTQNHGKLPAWFPWVVLLYFLGSITIATIVTPRFFRNAPRPPATLASKAMLANAEGSSLYLVLVWFGLFLYGAYETLLGKIPLERAIPAGLILLAFIALFSWSIRRMHSAQRQ